MRTKRAFFIVIAVLVILDIAAAFWYVAGRLNSDAESTNPFDTEKAVGDSAIVGETVPDKFEITERSAYFVSKSPVSSSKPDVHWTSAKRYKGRIPVSVNGSDAIGDLLKQIELVLSDSRRVPSIPVPPPSSSRPSSTQLPIRLQASGIGAPHR